MTAFPLLRRLATAAAAFIALSAMTSTPADALENGLARIPPMGFNNWNSTGCRADFSETMIKGIADLFVSKGIATTASAIGMAGSSFTLKDLWTKASRGTSSAISVSVPAQGTVLYRVSTSGASTTR